jgi:hypothetical protein
VALCSLDTAADMLLLLLLLLLGRLLHSDIHILHCSSTVESDVVVESSLCSL